MNLILKHFAVSWTYLNWDLGKNCQIVFMGTLCHTLSLACQPHLVLRNELVCLLTFLWNELACLLTFL